MTADTSKYITTEVLGELTEHGDILTRTYADKLYCTLRSLEKVTAQLKELLEFKTNVESGTTGVLVEEQEKNS